jgi:predicted Rossmann-fold nucleotide-binding protein
VEVSTWAQLEQHSKPIILANIADYWAPLIKLLGHMRAEQFIRIGLDVHFEVVDTAAAIVPTFKRRLAHPRRGAVRTGAARKL